MDKGSRLGALLSEGYDQPGRRLAEDLVDGGSDRLVEAIVTWGDMTAVIDRVRAHQSGGADHVCIQALPSDPQALPMPQWRELASALLPSN